MSSTLPPAAAVPEQQSSSSFQQPLCYQISTNIIDDPNAMISHFVQRQKELLDLELKWEQAEGAEEEKMGTIAAVRSLHKLQVWDISIGLYGRTIVTLEPAGITHTSCDSNSSAQTLSKLLPAHKLSVGDDVVIIPGNGTTSNSSHEKSKNEAISGVIHEMTDCSISIALYSNVTNTYTAKDPNDNTCETLSFTSTNISVIPSSSIATHNKMKSALEELLQHGIDHPVAHTVVHKMFANTSTPTTNLYHTNNLVNPNLDHSQRQAIQFALSTNDVALIHGPPGTGKTTAVVELIQQAVIYNGWKVLLCAPSNIAVDNVLERLVSSSTPSTKNLKSKKLKVVRIGHPARISNKKALEHSLEALVNAADGTEIVNDCKKELEQSVKMMISSNNKTSTASSSNAYQRKKIRLEINSLRKEIRTREEAVVSEILLGANVVCSTNVGASIVKKPKFNNKLLFDLVIIDEAAQALEASCWIPALCGKRLVLVGDHRQLPPTIRSPKVSSQLGFTMFDRAMKIYDSKTISRMLTVQYRMHKDISDWSSKAMYHGKLVPADSVAQWTLKDLPNVTCNTSLSTDDYELINATLLLIDTAGCDMEESVLSSGSRYNQGEASIVQNHVERLLNAGLCETDIAIITPYNGQVEILRTMLLLTYPKLEIRSVDGFQGCEKEAVILSLVRSNLKGEVGFLADDRRLNVAVTRARKQCTIVCNTETVSNHRFIKDLIQWFEEKGDYRSAFEFMSATKSAISPPTSASSVAEKAKSQELIIENLDPTKVTSRTRKKDVTSSARIQVSTLSITASKHEKMENEGIVKPEHTYNEESLQGRGSLHRDDLKNTLSSNPEVATAREEETQCSTLPKVYSETAEGSCDDDGNTIDNIREDKRLIHQSHPSNNASNQLLMDLSKERMQRVQMKAEDKRKLGEDVKVSNKGKGAQSKEKRLGREPRSKVMSTDRSKEKLDADEVLDDMDFLDKQIAEVQNSHGRNIEGGGTTYRTIVNGILLSRPSRTPLHVAESKASKALKEKLRQAEENRKVKQKKRAK